MSTTKSLTSQQSPQKPFKKIMTWNISRKSNKKHPQLYTSDSAPEDESNSGAPPASPTPSLKSLKSGGRPSLFATFARRDSTKSEHSSRSRSPTSPRPSYDYTDGIHTPPSPTPSRNSMIFERDIENHKHLSVHEAIDLAIPPVLDDAAEAFVNEEIPIFLTESIDDDDGVIQNGSQVALVPPVSLINSFQITDNSQFTPFLLAPSLIKQ
ncbi:13992_t:CDS:2 [Entrophospora sp. SA101]|nr:124_t:CDS:2 [Entrophospora sp. SA101]CAJ0879624.1 13992_t:CDS:2 [Entrophospora sp. SA101]